MAKSIRELERETKNLKARFISSLRTSADEINMLLRETEQLKA